MQFRKRKINVVDAYQKESIVWKAIISYMKMMPLIKDWISWEDWKNLACNHVPKIAETYGIDLNNICWNVGYHTNRNNPHIHLTFYSTNPAEGRLSKNNAITSFRKNKSSIVNDLFKEELEQLKVNKNNLRNTLKDEMNSKRYLNIMENENF